MSRVLHPPLLVFARVTYHELARMVQYRMVENAILRSRLLKVVQVTPKERSRLLKDGRLVGDRHPDDVVEVSHGCFPVPEVTRSLAKLPQFGILDLAVFGRQWLWFDHREDVAVEHCVLMLQ